MNDSSIAPDPPVASSRLRRLAEAGQSVWLDSISRDLLQQGELRRLIEQDSVTGVTVNPSIFQNALLKSRAYDAAIQALATNRVSPLKAYEALLLEDIRGACDLLSAVYGRSRARDGYVSLELNPHVSRDPEATLCEAKRLFDTVGRPNLMIKIPGTVEALPAITAAVAAGINVNVTLIFSVERYREVVSAWLCGLESAARARPHALARIASVASCFISRIDAAVDSLWPPGDITRPTPPRSAALANAAAIYEHFTSMRQSARFRALAARGAQVQRPLWASTSPKGSGYPDVAYVEGLVAADTVNTMPPQTLNAFRDHGRLGRTLSDPSVQAEARDLLKALAQAGVNLEVASERLEQDGLQLFVDAFAASLDTLRGRLIRSRMEGSTEPTPKGRVGIKGISTGGL